MIYLAASGGAIGSNQCAEETAMISKRNKLSQEIVETVPADRIFAAAGLMMRNRRYDLAADVAIESTKDEVLEFVSSLNVRGLEVLRLVALSLEGGVEQ
jgi:hypothetical protein